MQLNWVEFVLLAERARRIAVNIDKNPIFVDMAVEYLPSIILMLAGGPEASAEHYTMVFQWVFAPEDRWAELPSSEELYAELLLHCRQKRK